VATESRIILTRERESNRIWADQLHQAGRPFLSLPLVRFAVLPLPNGLDLAIFDWVLFTSPQGVRAMRDLTADLGQAHCGALGHGTASALREAGWQDDLHAGGLDGAALAAHFLAAVTEPCRILLPGPRRRMSEPRASLADAGHQVRELPLYETLAAEPAAIAAADLRPDDVLFFCSPSAVHAFAAARDDKLRCVAIGNTTADACRAAGFDAAVAATPDLEAMIRAAGLSGPSGSVTEPAPPEMES
jgi:uroporphyrinogen-III synthase